MTLDHLYVWALLLGLLQPSSDEATEGQWAALKGICVDQQLTDSEDYWRISWKAEVEWAREKLKEYAGKPTLEEASCYPSYQECWSCYRFASDSCRAMEEGRFNGAFTRDDLQRQCCRVELWWKLTVATDPMERVRKRRDALIWLRQRLAFEESIPGPCDLSLWMEVER